MHGQLESNLKEWRFTQRSAQVSATALHRPLLSQRHRLLWQLHRYLPDPWAHAGAIGRGAGETGQTKETPFCSFPDFLTDKCD